METIRENWCNLYTLMENIHMEDALSVAELKETLDQIKCPIVLPEELANQLNMMTNTKLQEIIETSDIDDPKELQLQHAILEFITTEAAYINNIRTAIDVFYTVAMKLQQNNFLKEIKFNSLFLNLPEILNINLKLWSNVLYPMVMEAIGKRLKLDLLIEQFEYFEEMFRPYIQYIKTLRQTQMYILRLLDTNIHFKVYKEWCESQTECIRFVDMLAKPALRLMYYSEFIKKIIKETDSERDISRFKTITINISNIVTAIDLNMRYFEELAAIDLLTENIQYYNILGNRKNVDTDLVSTHRGLNLKRKFPDDASFQFHRAIILDGALLYRDNQLKQEIEVQGVLLTDMVLICSPRSKMSSSVKMIRQHIFTKFIQIHPDYEVKANVKYITSLTILIFDSMDVVNNIIYISALPEPKNSANPTLEKWLHALLESQMTLTLLDQVFVEGRTDVIIEDTESEINIENEITQDYTQNILLEPCEAMKSDVIKAAKKRFATMLFGANLRIEKYPSEGVELREDLYSEPRGSQAPH